MNEWARRVKRANDCMAYIIQTGQLQLQQFAREMLHGSNYYRSLQQATDSKIYLHKIHNRHRSYNEHT